MCLMDLVHKLTNNQYLLRQLPFPRLFMMTCLVVICAMAAQQMLSALFVRNIWMSNCQFVILQAISMPDVVSLSLSLSFFLSLSLSLPISLSLSVSLSPSLSLYLSLTIYINMYIYCFTLKANVLGK